MEMASSPRTVEEIFKDFSARREGILRALSQGMNFFNFVFSHFKLTHRNYSDFFCFVFFFCFSDVDDFYGLCDPGITVDEDLNYFSVNFSLPVRIYIFLLFNFSILLFLCELCSELCE